MSSVVERAEELERQQILLLENKIVTQSVLYSSGASDPTEQAAWTRAYWSDPALQKLPFLVSDDPRLKKMPQRPTLIDYFRYRFGLASICCRARGSPG